MRQLFLVSLSAFLLSACSEPDQSLTQDRHMPDQHPSAGAEGPYIAAGWTPGDKQSWANQLRTRGQYQNEYVKAN